MHEVAVAECPLERTRYALFPIRASFAMTRQLGDHAVNLFLGADQAKSIVWVSTVQLSAECLTQSSSMGNVERSIVASLLHRCQDVDREDRSYQSVWLGLLES